MDEHTATEIAYKNGYKQAVKDIFAEIDKSYCVNKHGEVVVHFDAISEIKKKYTGGCDD